MPAISLTRKLRHALVTGFVGLLLTISAAGAHAATTTVAIGFDTDNNAATGCTLTNGSSSMPGVETVLYTVVTTAVNTGTVSTITRSTCSAGVFGAPIYVSAGGWPIGMAAGLNGSDLIETFIPLADLGGASSVKMGAITPSDSLIATGVFALHPLAPTAPEPIPSLSPTGMLILLSLIGGTGWLMRRYARQGGTLLLLSVLLAGTLSTVSALAIVLDGNGVDWAGIAPLATDSAGDVPAGQDVVALYAIQDGANLALRVDMVLAREAGNQQPVVNAGGSQTIALAAVATLSGSATDDGLPNPPATLTYAWSKVSGPGTVTFGNAASAATSASFSLAGTYVLRLSASDSVLSGSADATVTVSPAGTGNLAPIVNAGTNQAITLPATATLTGTATDDNLPNPPAHLATSWSFVSGPSSGVVFGNTASLNTSATFAAPGTYTLRLTANDGALSTSSDLQVTVSDGAPLFLAVADRTITLGTRYQQLLVATDANVGDRLTYTLLAAPAGAALSPAPLVDWTPTAAQLGSNTFTAKVTDSVNKTAQTTFNVTVVHTNQAPQLAPQPNVILPVGTVFTRTLQATDPDVGDVLAFSLVSGPAGMTLTSGALSWPTAGKAPGDYAVAVRVADAGTLSDSKQFTVTLTPAAPAPVAKDDSYEVRLGQTLTVPSAGVLGVLANDGSLSGGPLTAVKLTNPNKGALNAFNADGGFNYTAPATLPAVPGLNPVVSWRWGLGSNGAFVLAADFDHNAVVDYVSNDFGNLRAWRGSDGSQLWQFDKTITTNANLSACQIGYDQQQYTLGDVTGNGDIYLFVAAACEEGQWDRFFAVNASQIDSGKVAAKWKSERLSRPHPGAYATATSSAPADPPVTPFSAAAATGSVPTLAKLTAGGAPKLLSRFLATDVYGAYYDAPTSSHLGRAACRTVTGLPEDEGRPCKATFVIDATTGAIEQVLTAPNAANQQFTYNNTPTRQNVPIVADLDGDGQVEIISGGDVWKLVGGVWTLAWQAEFASVTTGVKLGFEPTSVAVADLDGDGKAEVIIHIIGYDNGPQKNAGGIHIFNHDGTLRRTIPIPFTWINGLLSVADVDGDGAPDILLAGDSFVYAYRQDGSLLWAKLPPDIISDVVPAIAPIGGTPRTTDSPLSVYDLNLDGVPEVIIQGTRRLFILNGRTGGELWSIDTESDGYYRHGNPLLVDADDDGHIDILVHVPNRWNCNYGPGTGPVSCKGSAMRISGGDNNWAPGPKVQNQLNFRPTATNDAAQILYDASVRRDFRQQIQQGTVIDPRIAQSTAFTYKANDGAADSAPAIVAIDIKPPNSPPVITSIPPSALLRVSPDGVKTIYTITAVDPDVGDTVHFELVSSSFDATSYPEPTVDAVTGNLGLHSCRACGTQRIVITVAAVDTQGARTEQSFLIDLSPTAVAVPNVIGQLLPDARTAIEAASLKPLVVTELFGPQPAGTVIGQDPLAGAANVALSATVRLTVSKGPEPFTTPFVVGQQLAPTNALLTDVGLSVNVATVTSTTIPVGQIMTQTPDAGTVLEPASAAPITLTVSAGGPLPAPIASIVLEPGPGPLLRLAGDELQYKAVAILTDGTSADVTLSAVWSSSQMSAATVNTVGIAKAIANGTTTISATRDGKTGQGTLNVASRVLGDNTPPTAAITSPVDGGAVTGPTAIVGTASDTNFLRYELAYALAGDENYTLIAEGTTAVTNGTLGTLDPTVLVNDQYTLRLKVFDKSENESVAMQTVQVSGGRKVGLFSLTYQDLNVPAAGIPLTIHRTYDSRDKTQGDFGIGWRLGLQTLRLRTNRVLGTGWVRTVTGPTVSLVPTSEHKVSVTLPNGRVEEFDMIVSPTSNFGSLDFTNVTGYVARPGTLGQLQALVNNSLLIVSGGAQVELVDDATLNTYSPAIYRYTSADGSQIEISPTAGVKKVTDRNGNIVTFGPGGILHSNGTGITFTRDPKGRIIAVTDPQGNVQTYGYDGNGDLITHTNPMGGVSRFAYDRSHGLIDIHDALGNRATRNEYDAAGRLIATIDANGNQVEFAHNLASQEELITDRVGNINRVLYDANGNVLSSQQGVTIEGVPVVAVVTMTYDAQDNETSFVDADGRRRSSSYSGTLPVTMVTDPGGLGLTTSFAYNARRDPTAVTDPGGRPFTFAYDGNGNLTGLTTPMSGATTTLTNAQGQSVQASDALGTQTELTRDATGNIIREEVRNAVSTLLRRMEWSYDANGNKRSETLYRTIGGVLTPHTTQFGYDAANRLTTVTDPLGNVARTEYNAAGQVVAWVDTLGRRTSFGIDAFGRTISTTRPDSSVETVSYDVNGNIVSQTDAAGRTTTFSYDELNRNVQITLPGGATTRSIYSASGRITATVDANGNRVDYAYDAAGRRTMTTLPTVVEGVGGPMARPQFRNTLNAFGAPTSTIDPLGRTTSYIYDANARLERVTFPDGTFTLQTYDILGRRTSVTNEEGQTTNYGYDGLGRLVSVSGYTGDATYSYDEAGNLLTQSDALGRVTRLRYDALNRPIERQYPGGEIELFAYDAIGNVVALTDANGRTTTFVHDVRNRMTRKNLPGGVSIDYAYAADGRRTSVTDARGITAYSYDSQGHLAGVTHPSGAAVAYERDANGNLLSLTSPAAKISYDYDALNRLVQTTTPEGASQYFYDLAGNRVRRTAGNGVVTDSAFDLRNRSTLLEHKTAGNVVLQSFTNSWSPAGRQTQVVEQDGSTQSYGYDAKGRLASESRAGIYPFAITHVYDIVGNRTQVTRGGGVPTSYTYDSNDRLLGDGTTTYAYDANGNLVTRSNGATVTQFGYDPQNRLVSALGGGITNQYAYDADGNRVLASNALKTTRFLVAGANNTGLAQVLEERDDSDNLQARYSYGNELLSMARAGNTNFVHPDAHGNTRILTNDAGTVTDSYVFDGYGNAGGGSGANANPYRYGGQRLDADTGLYQMRARYYDPAVGRFISRDPFGGRTGAPVSQHRYLYANADPVNNSDPTGQETLPSLIVAQFLNATLENAITLAVQGESVCDVFTASAVAGKTVLWGGLAASAFSVFTSSVNAPIKTGLSIWGINPLAIQSEDISAIEIRLDIPWTLAISASLANKSTRKISIGPKGFFGSAAAPILSDNIYKCGVPVGAVAVKAGVKAGADPFHGTGSATAALVAELVFFSVFRFEFPILELGFELKDGKNDLVDKAAGFDLLGKDKGVVQSTSYQ